MHMYTCIPYTHAHTHTHLHVVPSGHILTKLELQVLATLLATYSDDKLKEIQLSIHEK